MNNKRLKAAGDAPPKDVQLSLLKYFNKNETKRSTSKGPMESNCFTEDAEGVPSKNGQNGRNAQNLE